MKRFSIVFAICAVLISSCKNAPSENQNTKPQDTLLNPVQDAVKPSGNVELATDTVVQMPQGKASADLESEDFDYTYEGTINGNIKVKLNVFQFNKELKARAVYLSSKKIIDMEVACPSVGTFELKEKINGKVTGLWKVSAEEEDVFVGTWANAEGDKKMPINLTMTSEIFDGFLPSKEIVSGIYEYKEVNEDEESKEEYPLTYYEKLFVKNMSGKSIYFDLYIQGPPPGVHMGMVNGVAEKSDNGYVYRNEDGCEITMLFTVGKVNLSQKGTDINCEFGANIGAFGILKKLNP